MEVCDKFACCGHRRGFTLTLAWVAWSCVLFGTFSPVSTNLASESAILLSMKVGWGNPSPLSSWSSSVSVCSWEYVTCDSTNSTVTSLLLGGVPVNSTLPETIGQLVNLQVLAMSGWGLFGEIPSTIGQLASLTNLNLNGNSLNGSIPSTFGNLSKLTHLDLSTNSLGGGLPEELSSLSELIYLNLGSNHLSGALPTWIGNWTQLESLNLAVNSFQGDIPIELGNLVYLVNMTMMQAGTFSGLPAELGNLVSLSTMSLSQNGMKGSIPDSFGNLGNLTTLSLGDNSLSGGIPASLGNLTQLLEVDLSFNGLTSSIPAELGNVTALQQLILDQNQLTGMLPPKMGAMISLQYLSITNNLLSGPIPPEFGQLTSLTVLDLNNNQLSGSIPVELSNLQSIDQIDLSENLLSGAIPQNLTALPFLTTLNLEGNCLNGSVPSYNISNTDLQFDFGASNDSNCFNSSQPCKCDTLLSPLPAPTPAPFNATSVLQRKSSNDSTIYIAIGVPAGCFLVLTLLLFLIYIRRRRRPQGHLGASNTYRAPVRQYSLAEVLVATDNLTTKVGEGGFATVYKGVFKDSTVAAVKHFNKRRPAESFEQEAELHAHLNHRFLVNLIGYCDEGGELMLMYDFMDRGNLFENLHGTRSKVPLTWDERVKILINVARGVEYLHYGTDPPMIHRDIKSANILLSSEGNSLNAKLSDFGMGKQNVHVPDDLNAAFGSDPPQPSPTRVAGTAGYMDPEYVNTSLVSPKSDVYSFGVVLLELITGRQSIFFDEERMSLAFWAKPFLDQDRLWSIVDPNLVKGTFPEGQMVAVAALARHCIEHDHRKRPSMLEVMKFLSEIFGVQTITIDPSLSKSQNYEDDFSEDSDLIATMNHLKELIGDGSMNFTQSVILPRD